MNKILNLMVGASLALVTFASAEQPDASPSPGKQSKKEAAQTVPAADAPDAGVSAKQSKQERKAAKSAAAQDANAGSMPDPGKPSKEQRKAAKAAAAPQQGDQTVSGGTKSERKAAKAAAAATASVAASPSGAAVANNSTTAVKTKKLDTQKVEVIKQKYVTFQAQPRPDKVPTVTFNSSYRIDGANQWQGPQYGVFRDYQPAMHDAAFYRSSYGRVENFGGGAYYWNNGYWYPAWGYDNAYSYYPYDGPIYVGRSAMPVDRVIANVQAELQEMGYYRGEVDGLLGPLTRQALASYQRDNGLYATAVMDEPTLSSLGLG